MIIKKKHKLFCSRTNKTNKNETNFLCFFITPNIMCKCRQNSDAHLSLITKGKNETEKVN